MIRLRNTYLSDFVALIFPEACAACECTLVAGERVLCTGCLLDLPFTHFHNQPDNAVATQFWGKVQLQYAYAMLHFNKGGKVQNMVHRFKYGGEKRIGITLGEMAGDQVKQHHIFAKADCIIPVPLHRSKLRKRGFNQSECFAQGIASKLNIPVFTNNLLRAVATSTQTKKSRFARFENMRSVFTVRNAHELENKHILLVDDIVTTGSTLEACCNELLKIPGVTISVATIAYAV
jgi:ComF family protein